MSYGAFEGFQKREMKSRTFHLGADQIEPLKNTSRKMGISQSKVVRRSINLFIQELERYNSKPKRKAGRD